MPNAGIYSGLAPFEQFLHFGHFWLCLMSVAVALVPMMAEKGGGVHKLGGFIFIPLTSVALLLGLVMAWNEESLLLFCFTGFVFYLMLSGWTAIKRKDKPGKLDWATPCILLILSALIFLHVLRAEISLTNICMALFAGNGVIMAFRDWKYLSQRDSFAFKHQWLTRHVTGMIGAMVANLSVVALTLLPVELHYLWAVALIAMAGIVALRERRKKQRLAQFMEPSVIPLPKRHVSAPSPARPAQRRKAA